MCEAPHRFQLKLQLSLFCNNATEIFSVSPARSEVFSEMVMMPGSSHLTSQKLFVYFVFVLI